jgi:hypothetical protein
MLSFMLELLRLGVNFAVFLRRPGAAADIYRVAALKMKVWADSTNNSSPRSTATTEQPLVRRLIGTTPAVLPFDRDSGGR